MSKLRKHLITVLAVLFCALLCLSTALLIPKTETAKANSAGTVLEVYDSDANRFNASVLKTLYGNILKSSSTDYATLSSSLGNTKGTVLKKYSEMTPTTVLLGGLQWNVVAVSKNQKDEVVATLWLSASFYTSTFSNGSFKNDDADKYSPSEYGMSLIRSTLVGGEYATSLTNTTTGEQDSAWKTFLQDYGSYIDTPKDVCGTTGYQATEKSTDSASNVNQTKLLANEAYTAYSVTATGTNKWDNATIAKVQKCSDYGQWKDDMLWLPSLSETGYTTTYTGLWGIDNNTVRQNTNGINNSQTNTWLRSTHYTYANDVLCLDTNGNDLGNTNYTYGSSYAVRPALHLNLNIVDGNAREIVFGTSKTTTSTVDGTEIALLEHIYDNTFAEIEIPDWDRIEKVGEQTNGSYLRDGNIFRARDTVLKDSDYQTGEYEITVQPTDDFYWAGASNENEKKAVRKYAIHIKPATLTVTNIANPYEGVAVSGSLLQSGYTVSSNKLGTISSPTMKYYKVEPADYSSATRPPDNQFIEDDGSFTASTEGTYLIYYNVEVAHHTIYRGQYDVIVSGTDSAKLVYTGTAQSSTYGDTVALLLEKQDELKAALQADMKVKKDGVDDPTRFNAVWEKLEAVVCTKDGSNYKPAEKNGAGHYDVGTYYVDIKYKLGESQSIALSWDSELPKFEITKRQLIVQVIPSDEGELSSIYGEKYADMKFELTAGSTLADGEYLNAGDEGKYRLPFGKFIVEKNGGDSFTLDIDTPVGMYDKISADISGIINYNVTFEYLHEYKIDPRPVTLQVADLTVVYGTDPENYKFKVSLAAGSSLVNETLSSVATAENTTYSVYSLNGAKITLKSDIAVGEYEIRVVVTAENYKFEYIYGNLTVEPKKHDMSGVTLENAGFVYDGKPHAAQISGTLPDGVSVTYEYHLGGEKIDGVPTEIGLYTVYAKFTNSNENYSDDIEDLVAYLKIASSQAELDKGFPDEAPDPDGNNKDNSGSETPNPNPNPNPTPDPSVNLESKKDAAKDELDKAAQAKKDEIDASGMTDEEKKAAKDKVDAELAAGKEAIDKATDENGVNSAESSAKTNIDNISIDPVGSEDGGSFPWWILAVIAGAILLLTVLIIVIVKRRNSDEDDDGYDDFYDDEYDYDEEEEIDDGDEAYGF